MTKTSNRHLVLFGLCLLLAFTVMVPETANAQVLYGSVAGNVVDPSGAAIPGAEVTLVNPDTNYTQTAITNDTGRYVLPNVQDGVYTLSVTLTGFREYVAEGLTVTAGTVTRHNVALAVGQISDTVTVSSAATVLKTDTTDVSSQLESKEVTDLPLGAYRSYQTLINLVPGATPARFQNAVTDTPGRSLSTNMNGTARNSNTARIDGAVSVNIWLPHHQAYVPPAETVEVVNVSTNNFDAEQGMAGGAAIAVLTKSGTNDFHGNAFWLHENGATSARQFFLVGDNPSQLRNIFGGTIGGPIIKDKLFFFGGFEATLERLSRFSTSTLPTAAMRQGDFSAFLPVEAGGTCTSNCGVIYDPLTGDADGRGRTPFPNNIIPSNRLDPAAAQMAGLLPGLTFPDQLTSNHQVTGGQALNRYNTDVKIDYYATDTARVWGKWSWMDASVAKDTKFGAAGGGAVGGGGDGEGLTDVKVYGLGYNWTLNPTLLIDGNFGYTDMDQEVLTSDLGLGDFGQDVLGIPGTNTTDPQSCPDGRCGGIPSFWVDGYTGFGQTDGWSPLFRDENSLTLTQNVSWTKGAHEFRFGYDLVKHMLDHWQPEIGAGPRGSFDFSSATTSDRDADFTQTDRHGWATFMLGLPRWTGKSLQWELMTTNEWQHAFYVRDRWQATPNLTLTLGLRYEYYPLVTRDDRGMEVLSLSPISCDEYGAGQECFPLTLGNNIKVSNSLFAPRLGFAYRMGDNNVFRAGYGITYSPLPFGRPLRGFYPLTVAGNFETDTNFIPYGGLSQDGAGNGNIGIPTFLGPDAGPGDTVPLPPFVQQRTMPQNEINRGYIQSWNVVYERKLPSDIVATFGYVGTQTTNQLADHQLNWRGPDQDRQLSAYSTTSINYWDGWLSMNYHSLQVAINRRFTNGLFIKAAYTYSKAINMTNDEGWAGLSWNDPALISRNRAQAGYNRPHMLNIGSIYALPWGQSGGGVGNYIIRDWQINGILAIVSNTPGGVGTSSQFSTSSNSNTADQVGEVVNLGGKGPGQNYYDPSAFVSNPRDPSLDPSDPNYCTNLDCYGTTGRNFGLPGPTAVSLDFSIFRTFAITEGMGLEFRTEIFNMPNNPKFNGPNRSANSSGFMQITSTDSNYPARVFRFGLKLKF